MKRIASTLLLSIFLYNIIGYYFAFSVLNMQNKYQMSIFSQNKKNLQIIHIHKSEIKNVVFINDEKEFIYKGEMYDIKDKSIDGDYVAFHCMNDKKEKILLANLDKHIQNNIDTQLPSGEQQKNISKNILKDYLFNGNPVIYLSSTKVDFPSAICILPSAIPLSISSPPPQFSLS